MRKEAKNQRHPDGTFKLKSVANFSEKNVTFMWYSSDMFRYLFKAEFVTLVGLKVPSGRTKREIFAIGCKKKKPSHTL